MRCQCWLWGTLPTRRRRTWTTLLSTCRRTLSTLCCYKKNTITNITNTLRKYRQPYENKRDSSIIIGRVESRRFCAAPQRVSTFHFTQFTIYHQHTTWLFSTKWIISRKNIITNITNTLLKYRQPYEDKRDSSITIGRVESRRFCADRDQTSHTDGNSRLPYILSCDLSTPLHHTATSVHSNTQWQYQMPQHDVGALCVQTLTSSSINKLNATRNNLLRPSVILTKWPSVLWRCWLGGRKGIRPVKTEWWGTGMVICPEPGD